MKKTLLLLAPFILISLCTHAQYSCIHYNFSQSQRNYSEITGGTKCATIQNTSGKTAENIQLPFVFNYAGENYTHARVCLNGWLKFYNAPNTITSYTNVNKLVSTEVTNALFPLWDALNIVTTGDTATDIRYQLIEGISDTVCVIQWKNVRWANAGAMQNFQIRLYKNTNVIEFAYGLMRNPIGSALSASIGINSRNKATKPVNFISITPCAQEGSMDSRTVANDNLNGSCYSQSNTVYTFTPPTCWFETDKVEVNNISKNSAKISWENKRMELYNLQWIPDSGNISTNWEYAQSRTGIPDAEYIFPNLTPGETYLVRLQKQCPPESLTRWHETEFTTAINPLNDSITYYNNFDEFLANPYSHVDGWSNYPNGTKGSDSYFTISTEAKWLTTSPNPTKFGISGNSYLVRNQNQSPGATNHILASPTIELPENEEQVLTFYFKGGGNAYKNPPKFDVRISTIHTDALPVADDFDSVVFSSANYWNDVWKFVTIDLTPFKGKIIQVAFHLHTEKNNGDCLFIDEFYIRKKPSNSCIAPGYLALYPEKLGRQTATFKLYGVGGNWELKADTNNSFNPSTTGVSYYSDNDTEYTLTNLDESTEYTVYIRKKCSPVDTSEWIGPVSFKTRCTPLTSIDPYLYEDFTGSTTKLPSCWRTFSDFDASSVTLFSGIGTSPFTAPAISIVKGKALASNSVMLISPEMSIYDIDIRNMRVRFNGFSSGAPLQIGYMTNPLDANTFKYLGSAMIDGKSPWTEYIIRFDSLFTEFSQFDSVFCVAFKHGGEPNAYPIYIDNIWIEPIACKDVNNLIIAGNTKNDIKLKFETEAGKTRIWYREQGETDWIKYKDVSEDSATITGLEPGAYYEFRAQANCDSVFGGLTGVVIGKTFCEELSIFNLPYFENFDNSMIFPACLSRLFNYNITSVSPYNTITSERAYSGSHSLQMHTTGWDFKSRRSITILSPAIAIQNSSNISRLQLRFMGQARYGADLYVGIRTNRGTDTVYKEYQLAQKLSLTPEWQQYKVNFWNLDASLLEKLENVYIELRHGITDSNQFINIDDIMIEEVPDCSVPEIFSLNGVSSNTATFKIAEWDGAPRGKFILDYKLANAEIWESDTVYVDDVDSVHTIKNLIPSRTYNARVKTLCTGKVSPYLLQTITFSTLQKPFEVGFNTGENFESNTHLDWTLVSGRTANKWHVGTAVYKGESGKSIYISGDNGKTNSYSSNNTEAVHFFRDIKMPETEEVKVTFDWKAVGTDGRLQDFLCGTLQVFMIDVTQTPQGNISLNGQHAVSKAFIGSINAWQKDSIYIPVANPGDIKRLVFTWSRASTALMNPPAAIDNILIEKVPCVAPRELKIAYTDFDSIYIYWKSPAPNFLMEYKKASEGTWNEDNLTISPTSLAYLNLEQNTTFDFRMRGFCNNGYVSDPVSVATFNTLCKPDEVAPYHETMLSPVKCWEQKTAALDSVFTWFNYGGKWNFRNIGWMPANDTALFLNIAKRSLTNDWFISPIIDLKSGKEAVLEFDIARVQGNSLMQGVNGWADSNKFLILLSSDDKWNNGKILREWSQFDSKDYNISDMPSQMTHYSIPLGDAEGRVRIAFYGESKTSDTTNTDIYISNVQVNLICPVIDSLIFDKILQNSATISWNTKIAQKGGWELRYGLTEENREALNPMYFTGTDTTTTFESLTPATLYTVYYRSICGANDSSDWKSETFATKFCDTIKGVNITNIGNTSATVQWSGIQNRIGCEIAYGLQNTPFDDLTVLTINGTSSAELTNLERDSDYKIYLRSICETDVVSNWSSAYNFITQGATCFAINNLSAISVGSTTANLNWAKREEQNQWQISYKASGNEEKENSITVNTTALHQLSGLTPNTQYDIKIRSICSETDSSRWGRSITITTSDCPTVKDVNIETSGNQFTTTWNAGGNESEWEVCLHTIGEIAGQGTTKSIKTTSYTAERPKTGEVYTVAVRAKCSDNTFGDWVEQELGIKTLNKGQNIQVTISPNPAKDHVLLQINGVQGSVNISIIGVNGNIVQKRTIYCNQGVTEKLDISKLPTGTYTILLINDKWQKAEKLVVF